MRRIALALFLALAAALAHGQALDLNTHGLRIARPAGANDAYDGGLNVLRDTSSSVGGIPGHVNAGAYVRTIAGAAVAAFEWNLLAVLDNYATGGENVAFYAQGNKYSTGATWGGAFEVADTVGAAGATWGLEVDNWTTGPDNGQRVGLGVYVGDAKYIRQINGYPTTSEATYGVFIGATGSTPWARYSHGLVIKDTLQTGIVLQGAATRGIWLQGQNAVGVDLSSAQLSTAARLALGQRICFDQWDQFCVSQDAAAQELKFTYAGANVMRLTAGGHLYLAGQVHPGTP